MRAYLITTTILFVLVTLAHAARVVMEGLHTLSDPAFAVSSVISVVMLVWSLRLLRR